MSKSYLERITEALIEDAGLPDPIREFRFHDERKWRCDFVWLNPSWEPGVDEKKGVILEVEGGTWMKKGGHTTGIGYQNNCEKYNEATLMGFIVLRVTKYHLINGQAMEWVKRSLELR